MKRRKVTGYSILTLKRRLQELVDEVDTMLDEGRLPRDKATKIKVGLLTGLRELDRKP